MTTMGSSSLPDRSRAAVLFLHANHGALVMMMSPRLKVLPVKQLSREVHVCMGASPLRCRLEGADMSYTGFIKKPI